MDSEYQNWYQIRFGKLDENLQHVENCCLYFFAVEQIKTLHQTWMTYVNFIHYFTPWKKKFEFTWMLRWIFPCWETLLTIFQFEMATIVFRSYISLCGQLSPLFLAYFSPFASLPVSFSFVTTNEHSQTYWHRCPLDRNIKEHKNSCKRFSSFLLGRSHTFCVVWRMLGNRFIFICTTKYVLSYCALTMTAN